MLRACSAYTNRPCSITHSRGRKAFSSITAQAASWLPSIFASKKQMSYLEPGQQPWWNADTVAVVTGANKGIGFEIARLLAEQGLTVVLTARNATAGAEAASKISSSGVPGKVVFHKLDIADDSSINAFVSWLHTEYGRVSILVNNAGMAYKGSTFGADEAATTLCTNFTGTAKLCEALTPILVQTQEKTHGSGQGCARVVVVSSRAGLTGIVRDPKLQNKFKEARSLQDLQALADGFVDGIKRGQHRQEGYPDTMYGISKLCVSMYTRVLAEQLRPKGIAVNACCPGWCQTDMSSWRGNKTAEEGADTPVWLALRGSRDSGGLYGERKPLSW